MAELILSLCHGQLSATLSFLVPGVKICKVRAYIVRDSVGYYDDQKGGHWINDHIATPMSKYPAYRQDRQGFGLNVLGTLVIELEADNGIVGFAVGTGGEPGAWIVEQHLARFIEGARVMDFERIWDQLYLSTVHYGRKGLVTSTIGCVDVAMWDLMGKLRGEPVYQLLGGPVRDELTLYATGSRPDLARQLGFVGGKMPLHYAPTEGEEGMKENIALLAEMRSKTDNDFLLMYDCWMSLDVQYAIRLSNAAAEYGLTWLEEALLPDDYWGYAELRRKVPSGMLIASGEHEYTRWGFRILLEMGCADIIQPDVVWCGGLTELIKISALADARRVTVIPHGASIYSYHYAITRHNCPFAEFAMMSPGADQVIPPFSPLLLDEPLPRNGRMKIPDSPGFGVRLNPACRLHRPYPHEALFS